MAQYGYIMSIYTMVYNVKRVILVHLWQNKVPVAVAGSSKVSIMVILAK